MNDEAAANALAASTTFGEPIELEQPIQRGEQTITAVSLRRPRSGELRGVDNAALINKLDYGAMETLLPRITQPTLTRADVANLDPVDFANIGAEVILFFVSKAGKAELSLAS